MACRMVLIYNYLFVIAIWNLVVSQCSYDGFKESYEQEALIPLEAQFFISNNEVKRFKSS